MGFQKKELCTPEKNPASPASRTRARARTDGGRGGQQGRGSSGAALCDVLHSKCSAIVSREEESHLLMGIKEGQGTCYNYLAKFSCL